MSVCWKLINRCGKYLPNKNICYIPEKQLLLIKVTQIFVMDKSQIIFSACVMPPSKEALVKNLLGYLETLKIPLVIHTVE